MEMLFVETSCIDALPTRGWSSAFSADMAAPTPRNHRRRQDVFVFDDVTYQFRSVFSTLELEAQEALSCCGP